jgi:hypothetical protein
MKYMKLQTIKPRKTGLTGLPIRNMPVDPEPAGEETVPTNYFFEDNIESVYAGNHDGANGFVVPRVAGESVYDWIARAAKASRAGDVLLKLTDPVTGDFDQTHNDRDCLLLDLFEQGMLAHVFSSRNGGPLHWEENESRLEQVARAIKQSTDGYVWLTPHWC